jgi:predicted DNA binding CopG/RHH family protein
MKKIRSKKFKNEHEERLFWSKMGLDKHFKPGDFKRASFPNLKPSSQPISLRLPSHLIARVKEHANELDMPYQSLIKQYIAKGVIEDVNL